jgi:hypothetical protein
MVQESLSICVALTQKPVGGFSHQIPYRNGAKRVACSEDPQMPCREFTEGIFEESRQLFEALIQKPATIPLGERFSHAQVAGPHCSSSSPA